MPSIPAQNTQAPELPIRWTRPTPGDLGRWVRQCLDRGSQPSLSVHADMERMDDRTFTMEDVVRILRTGHPYKADPGRRAMEWKVNLSLRLGNGRDAAVACLVSPHTLNLTILTVMWVDH